MQQIQCWMATRWAATISAARCKIAVFVIAASPRLTRSPMANQMKKKTEKEEEAEKWRREQET